MADIANEREARTEAPSTFGSRLRFVGPGLIIAATGVGAGDMVSSLNAGTEYGMIFLWAILVGAFIKFYLTEGIGRWYMATGQTILRGWRSLRRFVSGFFVVYLLRACADRDATPLDGNRTRDARSSGELPSFPMKERTRARTPTIPH
jgi:Mn2+/Fe2+ NRAMP family transporter